MQELVLHMQVIMGIVQILRPRKSQHRVSLSTDISAKIKVADMEQHQVIVDQMLSVVRLESPYRAVRRRISSFHLRCGY